VQVLHPPQKSERLLYWNGCNYGIKNDGVEAIFNNMTSLLNFIKVYQLFQKLVGGRHRQGSDLISLHFCFIEESRLTIDVGDSGCMVINDKLRAVNLTTALPWQVSNNVVNTHIAYSLHYLIRSIMPPLATVS
jgi:hypothetical protein